MVAKKTKKRPSKSTASKRPRFAALPAHQQYAALPPHEGVFEDDEPVTVRSGDHAAIVRHRQDPDGLNKYADLGKHEVRQVRGNMVKMLVPGMVEVWVPMGRVHFRNR